MRIYKEVEQRNKYPPPDPALENGSGLYEVDEDDPYVQRLLALASEVRAWHENSSKSSVLSMSQGCMYISHQSDIPLQYATVARQCKCK